MSIHLKNTNGTDQLSTKLTKSIPRTFYATNTTCKIPISYFQRLFCIAQDMGSDGLGVTDPIVFIMSLDYNKTRVNTRLIAKTDAPNLKTEVQIVKAGQSTNKVDVVELKIKNTTTGQYLSYFEVLTIIMSPNDMDGIII